MESFTEIKKLFTFSIPDMINDIMMSLSKDIIELNQVEQLSEGVDAKNVRIITKAGEFQRTGYPYAYQTINERRAKGLQVDKVDLNFTGSFWKTFKVIKVSGGWNIEADFNIHGEDIRSNFDSSYDFTGLTDDNFDYLVNQLVFPELEKRIRKQLSI